MLNLPQPGSSSAHQEVPRFRWQLCDHLTFAHLWYFRQKSSRNKAVYWGTLVFSHFSCSYFPNPISTPQLQPENTYYKASHYKNAACPSMAPTVLQSSGHYCVRRPFPLVQQMRFVVQPAWHRITRWSTSAGFLRWSTSSATRDVIIMAIISLLPSQKPLLSY